MTENILLSIGVAIVLGILIFFEIKKRRTHYEVKKFFFSYAEKQAFLTIKKILRGEYGDRFELLSKVRLADIFDFSTYQEFNKIKAKHIDFLILDTRNYTPILGIELNGTSHFFEKQKRSDEFKKYVFSTSGLQLLTAWNSKANDIQYWKMLFKKFLINPITKSHQTYKANPSTSFSNSGIGYTNNTEVG
ncbi:MAG: DUF2726 domain-containing protein [candidate division SR1 bacterium]|nr:DUF2726 domain-containing protein [candidate division SR1 bacterium]